MTPQERRRFKMNQATWKVNSSRESEQVLRVLTQCAKTWCCLSCCLLNGLTTITNVNKVVMLQCFR
jgi:hypothetical protein